MRYHLEIAIVEGIRAEKPSRIEIGNTYLGEGYRIEITNTSRYFLVIFEDVLACQMTNKSYARRDDYEIRSQGVVTRYERSRYMDYIRESTWIDKLSGNEHYHTGLILADHIIDVIACEEPIINEIDGQHPYGNEPHK